MVRGCPTSIAAVPCTPGGVCSAHVRPLYLYLYLYGWRVCCHAGSVHTPQVFLPLAASPRLALPSRTHRHRWYKMQAYLAGTRIPAGANWAYPGSTNPADYRRYGHCDVFAPSAVTLRSYWIPLPAVSSVGTPVVAGTTVVGTTYYYNGPTVKFASTSDSHNPCYAKTIPVCQSARHVRSFF